MPTEDQLKFLEEKLVAEKTKLLGQLGNLNENVDFGDDVDHLEEEADETEEIANVLGLKNVFQKQLEAVEAAIQKIKDGKYGKCENCGKEIGFDLLEINPESKLCRDCKKS